MTQQTFPGPEAVILCTSTTHPANPHKGMRIYETDTGNELTYQGATNLWTPPWNTQWGIVAGPATQSGGAQNFTAAIPNNLPGLTCTWTPQQGRKYKTEVVNLLCFVDTAARRVRWVLTNASIGAIATYGWSLQDNVSANIFQAPASIVLVETGLTHGVSVSRFVGAGLTGTGTGTAYADANYGPTMTVTDIGPSGPPA